MLFSLFDIFDLKVHQFKASQAAAQKSCQHSVITFSAEFTGIEGPEQTTSLFCGEPIPETHAQSPYAPYPPDTGRRLRAEKAAVGSFIC